MAAGLGFKDFVTGEVLTAADVDGYLMQGVWVFADAAARTAAVTSPQEGNMSYLKDTNSIEYYSGSAWVASGSIPSYAAWTPTFSNLTVGNGTLTARYVQIGKMVHCYLKLAFGSTTSITGAVQVTGLPIAPTSVNASIAAIVQALYDDASGNKFWGSSHAANNTTSRIWLSPMTVTGSYIASAGDLSSTVPFTWTTTDSLYVSAIYEGV
jgi:hypothetical protein